ncbi:AMP-dependent synthetase/ligase [Virgisporangium aurantiacum]|uniref:Acyl-CoA synthetase n=1 Tax=Virgisporangium aurantiacum TaxID=175570 RepID=A0A8J4E338_9ACTN|nr:AMP-dependent synthetase/ligase [Virgisporangium aurantiacum]GIJ59548.1 long-chain acyl-CoA synthetase [Virgisporangium aurantiacum]
MVEQTPTELADRYAKSTNGLTVPALVHRNATEFPAQPALTALGSDEHITWGVLRDRVAAISRGLAGLGLSAGGRMLVMMSGRPEHWLVDLAAAHLGAVPSTVYATLSTDQLRYLGQHSAASIVVLEGAAQFEKWQPILDQLPALKHIVLVDDARVSFEGAVSLRDLEAAGSASHDADPSVFERTWRAVTPDQPVTMLYTSGTTGDPKGVVISHRNVIYQSVALENVVDIPDHARSLAYLPLAHIAERMLGIYNPIYRAGHVTICPDPTLLLGALNQVRPVGFFGVPRIWEKMVAGIQAKISAAEPPVKAAFEAATSVAIEVFELRADGRSVPADLAAKRAALDDQVLRPIRTMLGLENALWAGSGAAPIPVEVLRFLAGIGIDVIEVWGMTETTGTATTNTPDVFRTGSVGKPVPGMEIRLADDGEILIRGPLVCMGYLKSDGGVESAVDEDGWLATGDVGTIDEDGFLFITDRKKEIIITSGGKNIPPARIESLLRAHPLVAQAVAIGDRRPYITSLIVLDEDMVHARFPATTSPATDPDVIAEIQRAVDEANTKLSRPEQVKKFTILSTTWTAESGELTPKLSMRRRVINERYAQVIDAMY